MSPKLSVAGHLSQRRRQSETQSLLGFSEVIRFNVHSTHYGDEILGFIVTCILTKIRQFLTSSLLLFEQKDTHIGLISHRQTDTQQTSVKQHLLWTADKTLKRFDKLL